MGFVKQVFTRAGSVFALAVVVVTPVLVITRGPLNFLGALTKAASSPGANPALAPFADPAGALVVALAKAIVSVVFVAWMTKIFVREMRQCLPHAEDDPSSSYSIVNGVVAEMAYIVAVTVGFLCLFVPGVVVLVRGAVWVPVAVADSRGPIESFKRSWELTRGRHWPIQGLILLVLLFVAVAVAIVLAVMSIVPGGTSIIGLSVALTIGNVVGWSTIVATTAALYIQLSDEKEHDRLPEPSIGLRGARTPSSKRARVRLRHLVYVGAALGLLASAAYGYVAFDRSRAMPSGDEEGPVQATAPAASSPSLFKDFGQYNRLHRVDGELKRQWAEEIDDGEWSRDPGYTIGGHQQNRGLTAVVQRCEDRKNMCSDMSRACAESGTRCYRKFLRCRDEVMTTTCKAKRLRN